jgi:hypothetical protein
MEPEGSFPLLQVPATCPCLQPDQSSPCHHPTSSRSSLTLSSLLRLDGMHVSNKSTALSFDTKPNYSSYFYRLFPIIPTLILFMKSRLYNVDLVHNRYRKEFETVTEKYRRNCLVFSCKTCHQTGIQNSCNGQRCILRILIVFILFTQMIMRVCRSLNWNWATNVLFHGLTALGPVHLRCRGYDITLRQTTIDRTLLDERSPRHRDLCLTTHNTRSRRPPCPRRIRTRNPSKRSAVDSHFSPRAHRHRQLETLVSKS